jgi:hypothetical protein
MDNNFVNLHFLACDVCKGETMCTIIIYDTLDANIQFYVAQGNRHHLDGVYVNQVENNDVKEAELLQLIEELVPYAHFPTQYLNPETEVIVCGFLP